MDRASLRRLPQQKVTASSDWTARVWDVKTGQAVTPPLQHAGGVLHSAFSSDGQNVVTASEGNTARVWNADTGEPRTRPLSHIGAVPYAVFSPDGKYLYVGNYMDDDISILKTISPDCGI